MISFDFAIRRDILYSQDVPRTSPPASPPTIARFSSRNQKKNFLFIEFTSANLATCVLEWTCGGRFYNTSCFTLKSNESFSFSWCWGGWEVSTKANVQVRWLLSFSSCVEVLFVWIGWLKSQLKKCITDHVLTFFFMNDINHHDLFWWYTSSFVFVFLFLFLHFNNFTSQVMSARNAERETIPRKKKM